ncbi:hypothetical protein [Pontibacter virosus]|uniref:hypothetical protein n=1 Tax=Pontibacter virosus TaxID=1765052 RepID=UPI0014024806|nr:hypothetical protein [Pontibacter virosus]
MLLRSLQDDKKVEWSHSGIHGDVDIPTSLLPDLEIRKSFKFVCPTSTIIL